MPLPSRNTSAGRQSFSTPHCSHVPSRLRLKRKQYAIFLALMVLLFMIMQQYYCKARRSDHSPTRMSFARPGELPKMELIREIAQGE